MKKFNCYIWLVLGFFEFIIWFVWIFHIKDSFEVFRVKFRDDFFQYGHIVDTFDLQNWLENKNYDCKCFKNGENALYNVDGWNCCKMDNMGTLVTDFNLLLWLFIDLIFTLPPF